MRHLVKAQFPLAVKRREEEERRIAACNAALRTAMLSETSISGLVQYVRVGATSTSNHNKLLALISCLVAEAGHSARLACRTVEDLRAQVATAVSKEASNGNEGIVRGLAVLLAVQGGADVNYEDSEGWAPLHIASFQGSIKLAKVLLAAGAAVNKAKIGGAKPLYIASQVDYTDAMRRLTRR